MSTKRSGHLLALLLLSVAVYAAPASYTINFSGGAPNPTAGSFTYDPNVGFSLFSVQWDGLSFDLPGAMGPALIGEPGCDGRAASHEYFFKIVTQTAADPGCPSPTYIWFGLSHLFEFALFSGTNGQGGAAAWDYVLITVDNNPNETYTEGSWTVSRDASAVPEPSTLCLFGGGILALAVFRRRRLQSRN